MFLDRRGEGPILLQQSFHSAVNIVLVEADAHRLPIPPIVVGRTFPRCLELFYACTWNICFFVKGANGSFITYHAEIRFNAHRS